MKILCWNINGLRSLIKNNNIDGNKNFKEFIKKNKFDIICLQEIKINEGQLDLLDEYFSEYEYQYVNIPYIKKGYSGVCILSKIEPLTSSDIIMHNNELENEGRFLMIEFKKFYLINVYFPNAGEQLKRMHYKEEFNRSFYNKVKNLKKKKEIIIVGDFNAIQFENDTYNFKPQFNKLAGVTSIEMDFLNKLIDNGFLNTYRELYGDKKQYSYFTYRFPAKLHNKGMLIDFVLATSNISKKIIDIKYMNNIEGSDHLPIILTLKN
jgi:exodeoxyribonuclease III